MDFAIPKHISDLLVEIDAFIEREIKPLEQQDDNIRFFDHRREWARTDFEHGGLPRKDLPDRAGRRIRPWTMRSRATAPEPRVRLTRSMMSSA